MVEETKARGRVSPPVWCAGRLELFMKHVPLLSFAVSLCLAVAAFAQEGTGTASISRRELPGRSRAPGVRELAALLQETIDLDGLHEPRSMREALGHLQAQLKLRNRELPLLIDYGSFKEENPEGASIDDTQVSFPLVLRQMRLGQVLHAMLSRVDPPNATMLMRPGYVEVTTIDRADISRLLGQGIHATFVRRPLVLALEELYQATGVPIVLDTRAWRQARTPISASFTNSPSLGGALMLLSEMAGLKMLVGDNMVYITTPAHARQLLRERLWVPFHMEASSPHGSGYYLNFHQKRVE